MPDYQRVTFLDLAAAGKAHLAEIDDYVADWHDSHADPADDLGEPLSEYLGMTEDQYSHWVEHPEALQSIVDSHRAADESWKSGTRFDPDPASRPAPVQPEHLGTVGALRRLLAGLPDEMPVVLASDEEGNSFHLLDGHGTEKILKSDQPAYEIEFLDDEEQGDGDDQEDRETVEVLTLWP
jgi:hypothetical protein